MYVDVEWRGVIVVKDANPPFPLLLSNPKHGHA